MIVKHDATDISIVLDRSGSMSSVRDDTIGGFNTFLAEQKAVPETARLTLAQFDTVYELVHDGKAIAEVPPLDVSTFVPRGGTALLDAIGRTINATGKRLGDISEADRPARVVFVIITDGEENSSKEFSRDKVMEMVKHQTDAYKWQFVFIGANQDAIQAGGSMGFAASNSLSSAANARGTQALYASASKNLRSYRSGAAPDMAWTEEDRLKQANAGAVK